MKRASFDVYQDPENEWRFMLIEMYNDEEARNAHFSAGHFQAWWAEVSELLNKEGQKSAKNLRSPAPADL